MKLFSVPMPLNLVLLSEVPATSIAGVNAVVTDIVQYSASSWLLLLFDTFSGVC